MNPLRAPLEQLLEALAPLNVMGNPIASLDTTLSRRITEAVQALTRDEVPPINDAASIAQWLRTKADHTGGNVFEQLADRIDKGEWLNDPPIRVKEPEDHAYCIGCGTHPKGPYTCATCSAAEEHEGPAEFVSDWPKRT